MPQNEQRRLSCAQQNRYRIRQIQGPFTPKSNKYLYFQTLNSNKHGLTNNNSDNIKTKHRTEVSDLEKVSTATIIRIGQRMWYFFEDLHKITHGTPQESDHWTKTSPRSDAMLDTKNSLKKIPIRWRETLGHRAVGSTMVVGFVFCFGLWSMAALFGYFRVPSWRSRLTDGRQ